MKSNGNTFNPGTVLYRYDDYICVMYLVYSNSYCIGVRSRCLKYRLIYENYVEGRSPDCSITII